MTLVATGLGLFMIFLDATIVNVALPDIQTEFDVGEQGLQWVVAAYSLTMGMFIMSVATLADLKGRRKTFVVGIVIFAAASAACGAAPSILVLNIARGVQGVGAATVNVASLALVSAAFPDPKAKAKAIGIWTGIAAVGLAIGPTLGGVMTETIGWRSIFYVNVLMGAVAIVLVLRFVAESSDPVDRELDPVGQLLFIVGIGALTYALIEGPHTGWGSPVILGLFGLSAAIAIAFVWTELRARDPMMDVRVFRDRVYSTALITIFAVLFGIYGSMLIVTQYFQNVQDYSPIAAGLLMLANTIPTVVFAPMSGPLAVRYGARRPALIGVTAILVGLVLVALGAGTSIVVVLVGLVGVGTAGGLAVAPSTSIAMTTIPPERSGMASGIMSAQRAIGSTAGFAIMGSVLAVVVAATLPAKLETVVPDPQQRSVVVDQIVDDANPRAVVALIAPGQPLAEDSLTQEDEIIDAADDAFVAGIRAALLVGALLLALTLVAGLRVFPRGRSDEEHEEVEAAELEGEELARDIAG
jgi:EmrB/QacA subfamily drug resistance transporter